MQPDHHDSSAPAAAPAQSAPAAEAGSSAASAEAASSATPTPTASTAASTESAAAPSLEDRLHAAEAEAAEHHDAWLRAKAETENVRRRAQEDVAKAHRFGIERFAGDLLAVKDSLEAALAVESATVESLRSGVELTLRQLESAFEKHSLRAIDPAGEKFDPHRHQAISMLPSDKAPNTVINVLQKGYTLSDRVIRPALVTVAQPKAS